MCLGEAFCKETVAQVEVLNGSSDCKTHSSMASESMVVFCDVYYYCLLGEWAGALICSLLNERSKLAEMIRAFYKAFVFKKIWGSVARITGWNKPKVLERYLPGKLELSSSWVFIETIKNLLIQLSLLVLEESYRLYFGALIHTKGDFLVWEETWETFLWCCY